MGVVEPRSNFNDSIREVTVLLSSSVNKQQTRAPAWFVKMTLAKDGGGASWTQEECSTKLVSRKYPQATRLRISHTLATAPNSLEKSSRLHSLWTL